MTAGPQEPTGRGADLARSAAALLSVAVTSEPASLDQLVTLAARQVPACSGAVAAVWHAGEAEPTAIAATHPVLPELVHVQVQCGRGPVLAARDSGGPVVTADTLAERQWPEYAGTALRLGVRCSVDAVYPAGGGAFSLSLVAARPGAGGRTAGRTRRRCRRQCVAVQRRPAGRPAA